MSLAYIRDRYGVPAKRLGRVRYTHPHPPREGVIVGSRGAYLKVRLDGETTWKAFHPTWEIEYLA